LLKLIIEDDEGRKTVVPFVRDEITIGREEGNTIRLTERNVSRRHARLLRQNGHVMVEDLGSYNGIRINGERIKGQVPVRDGDLIQIGDYDLAIQQEGAQPAASPPPPPLPGATEAPPTAPADGPSPPPILRTPTDRFAKAAAASDAIPPEMGRRDPTAIIRRDKVEGSGKAGDIRDLDPATAPKLVVLNSEFSGREFGCIRSELTLGRSDENDISLNHRSLSRIHAKIVQDNTGAWKVIDLDSANGMTVNREPYAEVTLRSGDVIQLGHLKFKFVGPGDAVGITADDLVIAESSSKVSFIVGITVALLAAAGLAFYLMNQGMLPFGGPKPVEPTEEVASPVAHEPVEEPSPVTPPEPAEPSVDPQRLNAARDAMATRDFEKAVDILDPLKLADGTRPSNVEELLQNAREELAAHKALTLAQKALAIGKLEEAEKYLEEASETGAFRRDRDELVKKVAELRAKKPGRPVRPIPVVAAASTDDAKSLCDKGAEQMAKRQLREAEVSFKKCLEVDPTYPRCHKLLGANYAKLKEPERGAEHYRKFLRLAPNDPDADTVRKILETYEQAKVKE
jgi:ABC transport system ATP-binding/permease protein